MRRRTVLKGLGAGGVVAVAGGYVGFRLAEDDDPTPPTVAEELAAVGARYLDEYPDEADRTTLLEGLPALDGEVPEHPGRTLAVLAPQVEADYGADETVSLDGWVLSRTECRAAALYAL
jgi:hypothetical protein